MKIGVVGCGMVGSSVAFALVMNGVGREIILVDISRARAEAEANGIASAVARLVNVLLHDQRAVLGICKRIEVVPGCEGVTLGLPHVVGAQGAISTILLQLDPGEGKGFQRSASILHDAIESLKL
jgi:malate/lactate dehydrogenase